MIARRLQRAACRSLSPESQASSLATHAVAGAFCPASSRAGAEMGIRDNPEAFAQLLPRSRSMVAPSRSVSTSSTGFGRKQTGGPTGAAQGDARAHDLRLDRKAG